ncbi:MAG: leucyl aminopeptidase family protein [Gemmobacter sp.]|uniref:leucyl aminopeptidase family protein n=1 Tax=Gemmobacter sp. TaxID=1898957 RepID=UPI001A4C557C|nr:leucyl aminopeptidase family protein [Gemmobacter sp.]MBL8562535.1 leucyl aminopeptidase family protein [Gemmobacter sp.]
MTPAFADPQAPSRPLHVVSPDGLEAWLEGQPAPVAAWLRDTGFKAGWGEVTLIPGTGVAGAVIGLGTPAARRRLRFGLAKAVAVLPAGDWHFEGLPRELATEAALGWLLAQYRFDHYKPQSRSLPQLKCPAGACPLSVGAMAAGEWLTRDLINTPAADMGPEELQEAFLALADRFDAATQVVQGADLERDFPMVHAVGKGSDRAPRIMSMRWGDRGPSVTLVGKGVCFDTGGLNLKPSSGMQLMKKDMGGAATVMGLAQMIMQVNLPIRLRVIVPAVENSVSGRAMRPKDILRSRKGLTVEVNDTDAEGRLVLGDALAWAAEENPELLISMATLTGAARVAVGPDLAPYYTDDPELAAALEAGALAGADPVWRLPFHEAYEPVIEPGIADLDNAPGFGFAGSITAALFLRRFADHPRYMHFDIYGHTPSDAPARPKGGVGQGARALLLGLPAMLGR